MAKLREAEKKRQQLLLSNGTENSNYKRMTSDRTTAMLLAILIVFILTEFPQGILAILNAIFTTDVHHYIYLTLGDVLDLLSLVNSSVNFILYCLMSSRYRHTFCQVILPVKICGKFVTSTKPTNLTTQFYGHSEIPVRIRTASELPEIKTIKHKSSCPEFRSGVNYCKLSLSPTPNFKENSYCSRVNNC
jgi:hypothetical protein